MQIDKETAFFYGLWVAFFLWGALVTYSLINPGFGASYPDLDCSVPCTDIKGNVCTDEPNAEGYFECRDYYDINETCYDACRKAKEARRA